MSIALDDKHGLNPTMTLCFYCQEPNGVALFGKIGNKTARNLREAGAPVRPGGEAPRALTMDLQPCQKCLEHMKKGIILISVDEEKTDDMQNPYRSGGWVVVTEDFIRRTFEPEELVNAICDKRVSFMPDDAWDMLGLPRGASDEQQTTCS